jgi:hypothetical protein
MSEFVKRVYTDFQYKRTEYQHKRLKIKSDCATHLLFIEFRAMSGMNFFFLKRRENRNTSSSTIIEKA